TTWPRGDENQAIDALIRWCEEHPQAKLIVIDTLQKFRSGAPKGSKDSDYARDYAELSAIKAVADRFGVAIWLLHHIKKGEATDVFERASGSNAIGGVPDTPMVLLR